MSTLLRAFLVSASGVVFLFGLAACGYGPHPKNISTMQLTVVLVDAAGVPIRDLPIRVDRKTYEESRDVHSTLDALGQYTTRFVFNRSTTWAWESLTPPDGPPPALALDLYFPTLEPYGEFSLLIVLDPSRWADLESTVAERPGHVPVRIAPRPEMAGDQPSTYMHGAYYHTYTGNLTRAEIAANGEERRIVPATQRFASAEVEAVKQPSLKNMSVVASATFPPDSNDVDLTLHLTWF